MVPSTVWQPAKKRRMLCELESGGEEKNPMGYKTPFIEQLPDDLVLRIFSFLDLETFGRVQCWSKFWFKFIEIPYAVRYYEEARLKADEMLKAYEEASKRWEERFQAPQEDSLAKFPSYAFYLGLCAYETLTWDCLLASVREPAIFKKLR